MRAICVDDEQMALEALGTEIAKEKRLTLEAAFTTADEALAYLRDHPVDVAFLDINLRGGSGLSLAETIRQTAPDTRVIFTTGYGEYALAAIQMHAAGYLLKPVTAEDIARELDAILNRQAPIRGGAPLRVQCFGHFEVFCGDRPLLFQRRKSKELFAYLVDRRGAAVTTAELCAVIWPEKPSSLSYRAQLRALTADLLNTLRACGAQDALIKTRGAIAVAPDQLDCDYYAYLDGDMRARSAYLGEYMTQYAWAESTLGHIERDG